MGGRPLHGICVACCILQLCTALHLFTCRVAWIGPWSFMIHLRVVYSELLAQHITPLRIRRWSRRGKCARRDIEMATGHLAPFWGHRAICAYALTACGMCYAKGLFTALKVTPKCTCQCDGRLHTLNANHIKSERTITEKGSSAGVWKNHSSRAIHTKLFTNHYTMCGHLLFRHRYFTTQIFTPQRFGY